MWGKQKDYVRTIWNKYPKRFLKGSIRKFGKQLVVTRSGMEMVTGVTVAELKKKNKATKKESGKRQ